MRGDEVVHITELGHYEIKYTPNKSWVAKWIPEIEELGENLSLDDAVKACEAHANLPL